MTQLLNGRSVAEEIAVKAAKEAELLKRHGILPKLALLSVGGKKDNESYERGILKRAETVGVCVEKFAFSEDASAGEILSVIGKLNADSTVHGILMFRPLPKELLGDEHRLINAIAPEKDVDGSTDLSLSGIMTGNGVGFCPCTPEACIRVLDHYAIDPEGKHAVVIGRSTVVGKPLAMLLLARNATVTVCHSKTNGLAALCTQADILITAAGRTGLVTDAFTNPRQILIDVSVNWNEREQRLCGDADSSVNGTCAALTPVPGGIGTVTGTVLIAHVVMAAERQKA